MDVIPDDCAYITLKPDVLLKGSFDAVYEELLVENVIPVAFRCGRASPKLLRLMYGDGFNPSLDHWSLNLEAFGFAPIIGLLVCSSSNRIVERLPMQERLSLAKGSALPEWASRGSLRSRCGAVNRVFNVMHVPVSPSKAVQEACEWFGPGGISLLRDAARISQMRNSLRAYRKLINMEIQAHHYGHDRELNVVDCYTSVCVRLLHAIKALQEVPSRVCMPLERLRNLCLTLRAAEGVTLALVASSICEHIHAETIPHLLASMKGTESMWGESTCCALESLSALCRGSGSALFALDFLWENLRDWNVFVSDLERYLITTSLVYPTVTPR